MIKFNVNSIINYISIAFLIISGGGFVMELAKPRLILLLIFISIKIMQLLVNRQFVLNKRLLVVFSISVLYLVAHMICFLKNDISVSYYMYMILEMILVFFIVQEMSCTQFCISYVNIIVTLAIVSLCLYSYNQFYDQSYRTIALGNAYRLWMLQNIKFPTRNAGVFWEAGIYQCYLNIALFILLYIAPGNKGRKNYVKITIILITILTTLSTSGYIIMVLMLSCKLLGQYKQSKNRAQLILGILSPILIIIMIMALIKSETFYNKFFTDHISLSMRETDLNAVLPIIHDSGLFGFGAGSYKKQLMMYSYGIALKGQGNSIAYSGTVANFGILFSIAYIAGILKNIYKLFGKHRIILMLVILVNWLVEPLMIIPIYMFFYYGFQGDNIDE